MSCWTELYLPIQDVEWCTWITQDRAIPVVVKGIIYTKKCPDGVVEYDREKVVMCEKNTWAKVLVESWSDVNDPAQAITKRYTYLVWNTPFVWNPDTDLVDCWSEKLDIQTKQYCDNWETVWWTLVWDVSESTPVLIGIVFNKIDASVHTPISPVEWSCEVIIANRQIPVIEDCTLATTPTDVNWKIAEEVILWWSTKVIPVRIQENCIEPSLRDVIIDTDCVWTDETVQVEWNIQEVILHPSQAIKVVVDKSCDVEQTLADHQNGCLERSIPSWALVCNTVVNNFNFSDTDFVDFVIDSNDGNGNYVITQNFSNPAAATVFLNMTTAMNTSNSRSVEDIANWAVFFYFGDNNFWTVTQISPTSIQFQTFLEAWVNDVPPVLSSPCTDPITNTQYQDSSTTLRWVYDSQTIWVPVPNGWSVIVMTVTTYSVTTGWDPVITHIPAKQVVTYDINWNPVSDRYFEQSTLTEIIFDPATDVFKNVCTETITIDAQVPNCAWWLDDKPVNSLVWAYLLNQENKHTETVYDILTAVFGGTVAFTYTAPTNIAISYASVTLANDTVLHFRTDFGDWYNDVWPSPDHTYNADWAYEIKWYAITLSWNKVLLYAKEVTILNGVITYSGVNPHTVNRTYKVSVWCALQDFCGRVLVDSPYNADGSAYTLVGDLDVCEPIIVDELEDNAEWNPKKAADIVECEVVSGGGVVTEGVDANLNAISTLLGIPTPDNRHILLGNTLSISSTGSSNIMAAGLNVAATGLITGAQFTFNIDLIADSDPGDPADFGVVVWDNVAGTSVLATSITAPFPMSYDPQGSGLNFPIYANPVAPQSFQVVWTGDLPAGDYTVGFILQDQNAGIGADSVNLSVTHNITAGNTTTTKAQLVALDQCTINALTPEPVVAPIEVPNGRIIINPASMLVIVGSSLVRSFSVRGLDNAKYNISFDNSATWLTDIDGGDSWGEGNEDNLNISQVVIQPTVSGDRVFIHWETI